MFRITRGISGLLVVALLAAGCAKSRFNLTNRERTTLTSVHESRVLNAKEAAAPAIRPETHYAAGRLFESQGQFGKALEQYHKAVALDHNFAKGYNRIGLVLSKVSRHEEAAQALQRAVEASPHDAQLRNNYGFELMFVLQWDEAERQLRRAIELEPNLARAHINLAMALSKQHRFDEALAAFREVLPEPDAHYNMGLLYRGQQRYDQANESFQRVLALNPNFTAARKQLQNMPRAGQQGSFDSGMSLVDRDRQPSVLQTNQQRADAQQADIPVVPRRIGGRTATQVKAPRSFGKSARRPDVDAFDQTGVRGFASSNRFASNPIDTCEAPQMSYLDEFPTPVVEGDFADSVALIDDEVNCIRAELEAGMPGFVVDNDMLASAIDGVPSSSGIKPSPFIDDDPVFAPAWAVAPPANTGRFPDDSTYVSAGQDRPARLIGDQTRRVASDVVRSAQRDMTHVSRVDGPVVNPQTGTTFTRTTWPDAAASNNPRFNNRNQLVALDRALDSVRDRVRALERENDAHTNAYAVARTQTYRAQLASSVVSPQPMSKFVGVPQTLQDFARVQLNGDGPESLESILARDESRIRRDNQRSRKSTLVNDKPPVQKTRRSGPRTDARMPDGTPPLRAPTDAQPWYMPLLVPADEDLVGPKQEVVSLRDAWLNDFDELDSLIAIIRNEVVCEGSLSAWVAGPEWAVDEGDDVCVLAPEPIMSELPAPQMLSVCDPMQPDSDVDTITVGDARRRGDDMLP